MAVMPLPSAGTVTFRYPGFGLRLTLGLFSSGFGQLSAGFRVRFHLDFSLGFRVAQRFGIAAQWPLRCPRKPGS